MAKIFQLKISLKNVSPPVWRRVEVSADTPLDQLHDIIQSAMGWYNCHLHSFEKDRVEYLADRESIEMGGGKLEHKFKISQLLRAPKDKMRYTYDFGDDWGHDILLESIGEPQPGLQYPRCTAGKRNCPPEDCGGPWGYTSLLEALADPKHPEHEEMLEWMGRSFDAAEFDLAERDEAVRGSGDWF